MRLADLVAAEQQTRADMAAGRQELLDFLDGFRGTPVLVTLDDQGSLWSAEFGEVRWILAFSDEEALSRFAEGHGDLDVRPPRTVTDKGTRSWDHRRVMGRRLLCSVIPAVGRPCGVALDPGGKDGMMLPPVKGIVPDEVTADAYASGGRRKR